MPDPLVPAEEALAAIQCVQEAVARVAANARGDRLSAAELKQAVASFGDDLDGITEAVNGLIAATATLARENEELARQNAGVRARVRELERQEEESGAEGRH